MGAGGTPKPRMRNFYLNLMNFPSLRWKRQAHSHMCAAARNDVGSPLMQQEGRRVQGSCENICGLLSCKLWHSTCQACFRASLSSIGGPEREQHPTDFYQEAPNTMLGAGAPKVKGVFIQPARSHGIGGQTTWLQ